MSDNEGPCKPERAFNVTVAVESIECNPETCKMASRKSMAIVQDRNEKLAIARALIQAGLRLEVELGIQ